MNFHDTIVKNGPTTSNLGKSQAPQTLEAADPAGSKSFTLSESEESEHETEGVIEVSSNSNSSLSEKDESKSPLSTSNAAHSLVNNRSSMNDFQRVSYKDKEESENEFDLASDNEKSEIDDGEEEDSADSNKDDSEADDEEDSTKLSLPSASARSKVLVDPDQIVQTLQELEVKEEDNRTKRFNYLLKQTELWGHFMMPAYQEALKFTSQNEAAAANENTDSERSSVMTDSAPSQRKGRRKAPKLRLPNMTASASADPGYYITQFDSTPDFIKWGTMRDYQVRGLNWLISLYERGLSGILADEMGLGKTVQYLKHCRDIKGPHLIIAPKSTIPNWMNELKRWCPSLNAISLIGSKEERRDMIRRKFLPKRWNVCVTSYEMVRIEKSTFQRINYHYIVVDEAQKIKNENSLLALCVRSFKSTARLLLTGTPLQNNLHELWALLNFLLPDVFSSSDDFDSWFNESSCMTNQSLVDRLHAVLRPFLLRRIKSDVEKSLPPKKEMRIYVQLTPMQKEWYRKILMNDIQFISNTTGKLTKKVLQNIVMHLRKVCNHPYLFEGAEPKPFTTDYHLVENSGKMIVLDKLLLKLKAQKSRVLLFSQMTRVLDIIEDYCIWRGFEYCRLDGGTDYDIRQQDIDNFNAPDSKKFIYLLSTRAGGLGINLATANIVILYDSDWNPMLDLQAMDRAHRIGQTKEVTVFRFVSQDTAEEKIVERAAAKLQLDRLIIQQGRMVGSDNKLPTAVEMLGVVRFGADKILNATNNEGISDDDIDTILAQSKARSDEFYQKILGMKEENLKSLSIEQVEFNWTNRESITQTPGSAGGGGEGNYFNFEGKNYRELRKRATPIDFANIVYGRRRKERAATPNLVDLNESSSDDHNADESYQPDTPAEKRPKKEDDAVQPFEEITNQSELQGLTPTSIAKEAKDILTAAKSQKRKLFESKSSTSSPARATKVPRS